MATVIVDVGSRYIKCGYAGEGYPRRIFTNSRTDYGFNGGNSLKITRYRSWCIFLGDVFRRIFYEIL